MTLKSGRPGGRKDDRTASSPDDDAFALECWIFPTLDANSSVKDEENKVLTEKRRGGEGPKE